MNACYGGHAELVAFLIGHGADVDVLAPTAHRYRPLHRTVEFKKTAPKTAGHGETVRQLLAHGADPMLRGSYYLVDAVTVAAMGCTEYVPMLLEHVAGDLDLYTACAIADHERVARILAESPEAATQADADSRDGSWLPLQYCARCKAGSDEDRLTTATLLRLVVEIGLPARGRQGEEGDHGDLLGTGREPAGRLRPLGVRGIHRCVHDSR